ncbi:MAG: ADP-forming succinate--CoA ligase subunit beta [Gammaproteobacteria bacterium]
MNLHEYQAKQLLKKYDLPVPQGEIANSVEEVLQLYSNFDNPRAVLKAQIHAGGRGKAGGVKVISSKAELEVYAKKLHGQRLVTYQTDERGQPVNTFLLEEATNIGRELYLGAVLDRSKQRVTFMVSSEGGVNIEDVAKETPEKIHYISVDPMLGVLPFQCREVAFKLDLNNAQIKEFTRIVIALYKMFVERDLTLLEVNPLVITVDGNLLCLDAKINIDSNALYRQPELRAMRDTTQEDDREREADDWGLSYIALDGQIGCMVNGAGLAMATMDLVQVHGGTPANFLDVGGSATEERVREAFKLILSDTKVRAILINIFGGIVRCDLIADGIIAAARETHVEIPVVVRLEGNNAEKGAEKLSKSGLNIIAAKSFNEAAKKVVALSEAEL